MYVCVRVRVCVWANFFEKKSLIFNGICAWCATDFHAFCFSFLVCLVVLIISIENFGMVSMYHSENLLLLGILLTKFWLHVFFAFLNFWLDFSHFSIMVPIICFVGMKTVDFYWFQFARQFSDWFFFLDFNCSFICFLAGTNCWYLQNQIKWI